MANEHARRIEQMPDMANELWALHWCRQNNARVRFYSNATVGVHMNNMSSRRKTFPLAVAVLADRVQAARDKLDPLTRQLAGIP